MIDKSWKTYFRQILRNENYQKFALDTVCGLYVVYQLVVTCKLKMYYVHIHIDSGTDFASSNNLFGSGLDNKDENLRPTDC